VSAIGNESKANGEIINLGTEVEHTTKEGIEAVEQILEKKIYCIRYSTKLDQSRTKAKTLIC
jgi:nucleoside-diphosphate-sugar epimerase